MSPPPRPPDPPLPAVANSPARDPLGSTAADPVPQPATSHFAHHCGSRRRPSICAVAAPAWIRPLTAAPGASLAWVRPPRRPAPGFDRCAAPAPRSGHHQHPPPCTRALVSTASPQARHPGGPSSDTVLRRWRTMDVFLFCLELLRRWCLRAHDSHMWREEKPS
ncbi:hypothetical protein VPH35_129434 [Triticum aestivum]